MTSRKHLLKQAKENNAKKCENKLAFSNNVHVAKPKVFVVAVKRVSKEKVCWIKVCLDTKKKNKQVVNVKKKTGTNNFIGKSRARKNSNLLFFWSAKQQCFFFHNLVAKDERDKRVAKQKSFASCVVFFCLFEQMLSWSHFWKSFVVAAWILSS